MAAQCTTSAALFVVLLAATFLIVAQADTIAAGTKGNGEPKGVDLVVEACKNLTSLLENIHPHFYEEPCVSVLRSDKRSAVAKDYGDLVMVALDLLDRRINEVAARIDSMLRSSLPVHNRTEHSFQYCAADFASMVRTLPICREIFLVLKPLGTKVKEDDAMAALLCMDKMGIAARSCAMGLLWDYEETMDFFHVGRYISLPWGLMELATGCMNDNSNW